MTLLISGICAVLLRFFLTGFLKSENPWVVGIICLLIIGIGGFFVLYKMAGIIEDTTEILSRRTKLAGGFLQSIGTAFPDMVIGIVAAVNSLQVISTDYALAISYALIAAAATFGSNIYNIAFAAWCIFRQNRANETGKKVAMFPGFKFSGLLSPFKSHTSKPTPDEVNTAIDIINVLNILTALVAVSMVIFGKTASKPEGFSGDLYQLIAPVALVIMIILIAIMYKYRKSVKKATTEVDELQLPNPFAGKATLLIFGNLLAAGVFILFTAESMVSAIERLAHVTGLPVMVAGVAAGLIGCLGEMIVVYNFSVNPEGRIGDAIVGVGMDNIVTILGSTIVALMGGIFLGGTSLILIFVIIFALNSVLMWQVSRMKDWL